MLGSRVLCLLVAPALLVAPLVAGEAKVKKPHLEMRVSPRMAFSPVTVLVTAELTGGADTEDFHCPELEWDWDDGGKSVTESDCEPYQPGTAIERRFTGEHAYRRAGVYNVKLTMRRKDRPIAQSAVKVTVRPGAGDPTMDRDGE